MNDRGLVWRDGKLVGFEDATCHVLSHMAARGSQVFDVLLAVPTVDRGHCVVGLRPHVTRFVHSAELMGMTEVPGVGELEAAVIETVAANLAAFEATDPDLVSRPWIIKVIAAWADQAVGLMPSSLRPTVYVTSTPWGGDDAVDGSPFIASPVAVRSAEIAKMPPEVMPPSLKVGGGYTAGVRAHLQANEAGYDFALLRTVDGDLAESTTSSILVVRGGRILAPPLDTVLDGITRRLVLDVAQHQGVPVDVRSIYWDEVEEADELFMSSTNMPVVPVGRLDQRTLDAPGPITAPLAAAVAELYAGDHPLAERWLAPLA